MQTVPLSPIPNQTLFVSLGTINNDVQLNIYQKLTGLFMDVLLAPGQPVIYGCLCKNVTRCIMNSYLGFSGDLTWYDTTGLGEDPVYTGLGDRFALVYFAPGEGPTGGFGALFLS